MTRLRFLPAASPCGTLPWAALFLLAALFSGSGAARAAEVDSRMLKEPLLELSPVENQVDPRLRPLWLKALDRPEDDLKRQAADAFARAAAIDMADDGATSRALAAQLDDDVHPLVELSVIRALIGLGARDQADLLRGRAATGRDEVKLLVEPALAAWGDTPIRAVWQERLSDPRTGPTRLRLAIDGAVQTQHAEALPALWQLLAEPRLRIDLRLAAATAVGKLEQDRNKLLSEARARAGAAGPPQIPQRLMAAALLARQKGPEVAALLGDLAIDEEPAVAAAAVEPLLEIDLQRLWPLTADYVRGPDTRLRQLSIEALRRLATPEAVERLGPSLGDPHPGLRVAAQEVLIELAAQDALREPVERTATSVLAKDDPLALVQAALVVGSIDHEPAADRLVELLDHHDTDVQTAAAWGLQSVAVADTVPAIRHHLVGLIEETARLDAMVMNGFPVNPEMLNELPRLEPIYARSEQLLTALGRIGLAEDEALFRQFLPKPKMRSMTDPPDVRLTSQAKPRAAAIWSLGKLEEYSDRLDVAKQLIGRLNDQQLSNPEAEVVQQMSAVSLGRMKAEEAIEALGRHYPPEKHSTLLTRASGWALEQITGEKVAPPLPEKRRALDWFLVPLGE